MLAFQTGHGEKGVEMRPIQYTWSAGKSGYLSNYVYENNYDWAQLWFNNIVSFDITINGSWKADSV